MTETSSVTQCPNCRTAFHIGLSQLDAARGKVRCGSCLEVFDAKENFVVEQTHLFDDQGEVDVPESPESLEPFDDQASDDDEGPIFLGGYEPDSGTTISREEVRQTANSELEKVQFETLESEDNTPIVELDDQLDNDEKDAFLRDVLGTVDELEKSGSLEELESLDTAQSSILAANDRVPSANDSANTRSHFLIDDETSLETLEAELIGTHSKSVEPTPTEQEAQDQPIVTEADDSIDKSLWNETTDDDNFESEHQAKASDESLDGIPETAPEDQIERIVDGASEEGGQHFEQTGTEDTHHDEFEPENVRDEQDFVFNVEELEKEFEGFETTDKVDEEEFTEEVYEEDFDNQQEEDNLSSDYFIEPESVGRPAAKVSHWGWHIAAACLALVVVAELLYWQPMALRKQIWFQETAQILCSKLPCVARPYINLNDINIAVLIEPNTDLNGILTAYVELRNRSDVRQGFPSIEIQFSDVRGITTASRIITPDEYLRGAARTLTRIPPNRPVQLQIDFVDPGETSSSYQFNLINPNST